MNILAARVHAGEISGTICYNDEKRPSNWKKYVGYIEQQDVMYENLTVFETLMFAARLRMDAAVSYEEKEQRVRSIIRELGLTGCMHSRIGGGMDRGISGGEKKRVAIAIELVTNPSIIFLDEPTSGLDSFTASNLIEMIKNIAKNEKKIIIMTIHQPKTDILLKFDKVLLLALGKTVFMGSVNDGLLFFKKCGFECPQMTNPADFFLDKIAVDSRSPESKAECEQKVEAFHKHWSLIEEESKICTKTSKSDYVTVKFAHRNHILKEFWILLERSMKDVVRDKLYIGAVSAQTVILLIILSCVYFKLSDSEEGIQNRIGVLFFICVNMIFSTIMPIIHMFPSEREILQRERYSNTHRVISVMSSKFISSLPIRILSSTVFGASLYWIIGLTSSAERFLTFLVILNVYVVTSIALGMFIGIMVPSAKAGEVFGPLSVVIFTIFGGNLVNLDSVTWAVRWLSYVSPVNYAYKAFFQNEFEPLVFNADMGGKLLGSQVISKYSLDDIAVWPCIAILAAHGIVYLIAGYIVMRYFKKPNQRL